MGRKKQTLNHPFFDTLSKAYTDRLKELNITKYAVCRDWKLNRNTCDTIIKKHHSLDLATLLTYMDAVGLKLKIVKKNEN